MPDLSQEFVFTTTTCPQCNNPIRTNMTAVSVFCLRCKTWSKYDPEADSKEKNSNLH